MKQLHRQAMLAAISAELERFHLEPRVIAGSGEPRTSDTLRAVLPVTDDGDNVLMEFVPVELNDEADGVLLYTTLTGPVGRRYEELVRILPDWNFDCPVGAFGIFRPERQLCHKYMVLLPKSIMPVDAAERVMAAFDLVYQVLCRVFPEAAAYAAG